MATAVSFVNAQQEDVASNSEKDSTLVDREERAAIAVSNIKIDGQLMALETHEDGKFKLRDLEEAWRYDSLWLNELHSNAELFSDMLLEIQNGPGQDSIFTVDLPTDTLKARLARMDEKTPFNILKFKINLVIYYKLAGGGSALRQQSSGRACHGHWRVE